MGYYKGCLSAWRQLQARAGGEQLVGERAARRLAALEAQLAAFPLQNPQVGAALWVGIGCRCQPLWGHVGIVLAPGPTHPTCLVDLTPRLQPVWFTPTSPPQPTCLDGPRTSGCRS